MTPMSDAVRLTAYMGEAVRHEGHPLYEAIVLAARDAGLAGATVLRGPMGYGHRHVLHTANILRLSADMPMVVEIVDARDKIEAFLPRLATMMPAGLITCAPVTIVRYGPAEA